jgi:hypothetical protein
LRLNEKFIWLLLFPAPTNDINDIDEVVSRAKKHEHYCAEQTNKIGDISHIEKKFVGVFIAQGL